MQVGASHGGVDKGAGASAAHLQQRERFRKQSAIYGAAAHPVGARRKAGASHGGASGNGRGRDGRGADTQGESGT